MRFFQQRPEVIAMTSHRLLDGPMGSSTNPGPGGRFARNREEFLGNCGIPPNQVVMAGLVHGDRVVIVSDLPLERRVPDTDGLMTPNGFALAVATADCYPVFFYTPGHGTVGIAHAGWRGIASHPIVPKAVMRLGGLGVKPSEVLAAIGPGINQCCFTVQDDENGLRNYREHGEFVSYDGDGTPHVDLLGILLKQLAESGIERRQVEVAPGCTAHPNTKARSCFYSRRRDRLGEGANMLSVIMFRGW